MRQIFRHYALNILSTFSKPAKGIHILNGHVVHRTAPNIDIILNTLNKLNSIATFISIEEALSLIENRINVNDPLVAFTFDDGFEECATMIAPALDNFGVNGLFFVNPNFIDGDECYVKCFTEKIVNMPDKQPMRWGQIKELHNNGHIIGAHTLDHSSINSQNMKELRRQIVGCKNIIEKHLLAPCSYFAFPFGRQEHANTYSIELAKKHYKYVFSQSDYKNYYSFEGKVINRRHFEPYWPSNHIRYFISKNKQW